MKSLSILIVLYFHFTVAVVFSAPVPHQYILNKATRECSKFYAGDECVSCEVPRGWTIMPSSSRFECPEGYKEVEIKPTCHPQKNSFCCTQGHSGAPGNCQDLVLNDRKRKCAFVEDINKCSRLPEGWQRQRGESVCPFPGYEWLGGLIACPDEFIPPMMNGMRVDQCLTWGKDCGQPAADYFCQRQRYAGADAWRWEHVEPTFIQGDGQVCKNKGCGGFSFIRCVGKK